MFVLYTMYTYWYCTVVEILQTVGLPCSFGWTRDFVGLLGGARVEVPQTVTQCHCDEGSHLTQNNDRIADLHCGVRVRNSIVP